MKKISINQITQFGLNSQAWMRDRGWRGDLVSLFMGILTSLAFAPFHYSYLAVVCLAFLFWQWQGATAKNAMWRGALFGFGMFVAGVSWVYMAMHIFGHMASPVAVFFTVLLVVYMALFPAFTGYLSNKYFASKQTIAVILILASLWVVTEFLRGWLFTGFPWLVLGYSQTSAHLFGFAPIVGVYGISWLCALVAAIVANQMTQSNWCKKPKVILTSVVLAVLLCVPGLIAIDQSEYSFLSEVLGLVSQPVFHFIAKIILWLLVLPFIFFCFYFINLGVIAFCESLWHRGSAIFIIALFVMASILGVINWGTPSGEPLSVTVLQGNVPQDIKWRADQRLKTMKLYADMTEEHWQDDIIVYPENAIPAYAHTIEKSYLQPLAEKAVATDTALIIGIPIMHLQTEQYYNGMIVIGKGSGEYLKHHLVPFGEYIPLHNWIGGILQLMEIPMSDFSSGSQDQPLLKVKGHDVAISICYEDTFPGELIRHLPAAAILVNASNNAWYGDSLAPHQHLQIAQMRAKETGRYILRATTNGISAIIDHHGRIVVRTPQFKKTAISAKVVPREGSTPFVFFGNYLIGFIILLSLLWVKRKQLQKLVIGK